MNARVLPGRVRLDAQVKRALSQGRPVVALETAVATHGLPPPFNLQAVHEMAGEIRDRDAVPAVCLVSGGELLIGADLRTIEAAAAAPDREKAAVRDLGHALTRGVPAGLTVSATLFAAALAGIRVFATGGIGGVHLDAAESGDISADLHQLARSPVITVCAGAKSILDIPRTLEFLEMLGVPVFGYRADTFPAFYLRSSGIPVACLNSPAEIAAIAGMQWELGDTSGILIGNPLNDESAVRPETWHAWLDDALQAADRHGIRGKAVTPFLLSAVAESSAGATVRANLALLRSNAALAAEIAGRLAT